jgi:hypothetical protein
VAAVAGDICILLASSRPVSERASKLLDQMRVTFGGELVEPLHVTADRVVAENLDELTRAIRECLPQLRPAAVRVDRLFFLPSRDRGPQILKLSVVPVPALDHTVDGLRAALRRCGLPSLHEDDRSTNITTLQRITGSAFAEAKTWDLPIELFVGDRVIVSRLRGPVSYEILDAATIPMTG